MTHVTTPLPTLAQSSCATIVVRNPSYDPHDIDGMGDLKSLSHQEEMLALFTYASSTTGNILEVGSYCGYTAIGLAFGMLNRESLNTKSDQVFTVDMHRGVDPRDRHDPILQTLEQRQQPATFQRYTVSAKKYGVWDHLHPIIDDSSEAWKYFSDTAGMLFIDGDHDQCLRDFEQWSRFLSPGAIVCFHDYWDLFPQVQADVDSLVASRRIEPIERVHTLFISRLLNG